MAANPTREPVPRSSVSLDMAHALIVGGLVGFAVATIGMVFVGLLRRRY